MAPKSELLRIAAYQGIVLPDPTGKAPGRGAYVCRQGPCLQRALVEGRLQRSLGVSLTPEAEAELLAAWNQLQTADPLARILGLIGLGRRGRRLASGTQAVEVAIKKGEALLVIQAADAGASGQQALERLTTQQGVPLYRLSTAETLGQLTGKVARTALAVTDEALAQGLRPLLEAYRQQNPDPGPQPPILCKIK